jgi:hypothetical protein
MDQLLGLVKLLLEELGRLNGLLSSVLNPEQVVSSLLNDSLGLLLKVWFGFILRTTDFETGHSFIENVTINRFEPSMQVVANAALALVVVWSSYRIIWGGSVRTKYAVRLLLPRLLMGTILINFALPLIQIAVDSSNIFCDAIQSFGTIPDWHTWWTNYALDQTHGLWQVVTTAALVLGYEVLAVTYLVRYAILIVLAITAPLAGLLFTLPDTHHLAKLWTSLFLTNLFMQPAQLFVLAIGFALENGGHTPVHHLFALAALLIVFKIPGALGGAEKTAHKLESALTAGLHGLAHLVAHA